MSDMALIHYQIDDDLHRRAKAAAALNGETLKDFLVHALEAATERAASDQGKRGSK